MSLSLPTRQIVIDSNEIMRTPLIFGLPAELMHPHHLTLPVGDYSLLGLEYYTAVELKRINDLAACCGQRRNHFRNQLKRLTKLEHPHIVLACTISDIVAHGYRSEIPPRSILGTLASYANIFKEVQFHFVDQNEALVAAWTRELLCKAEIQFERKYGKLKGERDVGRTQAAEDAEKCKATRK